MQKVRDLEPLSEAEQQVVAALNSGKEIEIGDGQVPQAGDLSRRVRAGLIRVLLLADDPDPKYRLHESGLQIKGALMTD